jgi:hypothetical protein
MVLPKSGRRSSGEDRAAGREPEEPGADFGQPHARTKSPAAIRPLDGADAHMNEGMDAIQYMKTMAGSPDAESTHAISLLPSCAWSLRFGASVLS